MTPTANAVGDSRTASCGVVYALGGGNSGRVVCDGGIRTTRTLASWAMTATLVTTQFRAGSAPATHAARGWQPFGPNGRSHGSRECGGLSLCVPACALDMSMPGIADVAADAVEETVSVHATAFAASTSWRTSGRASREANRRRRSINRKIPRERPSAQTQSSPDSGSTEGPPNPFSDPDSPFSSAVCWT